MSGAKYSITTPDKVTIRMPPSAPPPEYGGGGDSAGNFDVVSFWPRCLTPEAKLKNAEFEDFDDVVKHANEWILNHPGISIKKIETVEQKVGDLDHLEWGFMQFLIDDLRVSYRESVVNLYGLRIWFYKHPDAASSHTQVQLGYIDVVPRCQTPHHKHPTFDLLSNCVDQLNELLQQRPPAGTIVTVETVEYKVPKWAFQVVQESGNTLCSKTCAWVDEQGCRPVSFLRAVYVTGPPAHGHISVGFCDFLPDCVDSGGTFSLPVYDSFDAMFLKARQWLHENPNLKVANIQTLHVVRHDGVFETVCMVDVNIDLKWRLRYLRVFTLYQHQPHVMSKPVSLTYKTMMPLGTQYLKGVGERVYQRETMVSHLERVRAWLHAAGATVFSAETICLREYPPDWDSEYHQEKHGSEDQATVSGGGWHTVRTEEDIRRRNPRKGYYRLGLVYGFRLYFDVDIQEPSPDLLPPPPDIEGEDGCCNDCVVL